MTPTPPSASHFSSHWRLRRARNAQQEQTPQTTPTPQLQGAITPLQNGSVHRLAPVQIDSELDRDEDEHEAEEEDQNNDEQEDNDDVEEDDEDDDEEEEGGIEEVPMELDSPFDATAMGLKEIGNLASWTVSSCKPGCGVEALRDDDTSLFWQSDGPQPHHLNIHFSRLVSIRSIRLYLDFEADESYTPTRITLLAGTGYHDLITFSALEFTQPKGWIDVPLDEVGGGEDGKTLRAFLVQVRVVENHQNGKDTHLRGLKIYARDERVRGGIREGEAMEALNMGRKKGKGKDSEKVVSDADGGWLVEPDWMGEVELR